MPAVAGGAGGGGDAGDGLQETGGVDAVDADVQGVRQAVLGMAVGVHPPGELCFQAVVEAVAKLGQTVWLPGFQVDAGEIGGGSESHGQGNVFGAGAASVFLPAAGDEGVQGDAVTDVERADAFGGVHRVTHDGQ